MTTLTLDDLFDFDSQATTEQDLRSVVADQTSDPDDVFKNANFFRDELTQFTGKGFLQ